MKSEQAVRLRQGREQSGYTQKDAAHLLNVAESTYRDWERPDGAEPASTAKLIEVATLFNISLDWWLAGKQCGPSLSEDEHRIIRTYQTLDEPVQEAVLLVMDQLKP